VDQSFKAHIIDADPLLSSAELSVTASKFDNIEAGSMHTVSCGGSQIHHLEHDTIFSEEPSRFIDPARSMLLLSHCNFISLGGISV